MHDHELAMLTYVQLADIAQQKRQLLGRNKFLLLAGMAACRAGWPDVAEKCRELVLTDNRAHLIGNYASIADALRDPDFLCFEQQLQRFCPYEKAEHLLQQLGIEPGLPPNYRDVDSGTYLLELLSRPHWAENSK